MCFHTSEGIRLICLRKYALEFSSKMCYFLAKADDGAILKSENFSRRQHIRLIIPMSMSIRLGLGYFTECEQLMMKPI